MMRCASVRATDTPQVKRVILPDPDTSAVLDHLTTRDISRIQPGQASYLSVLTEQGTWPTPPSFTTMVATSG